MPPTAVLYNAAAWPKSASLRHAVKFSKRASARPSATLAGMPPKPRGERLLGRLRFCAWTARSVAI